VVCASTVLTTPRAATCTAATTCLSLSLSRPQCGLDEGRLARWLVRLEQGYPPNPYHNRTHAADVTRNVHVLLTRGGMAAAAAADDLSTLAAYLAAVSGAALTALAANGGS
jgi:hypothetical protein